MLSVFTDLNWIAVAVSAVVSIVLAGLYFGLVIAKPYVVALGRQDAPKPEQSVARNVGPLVCIIVTTLASAVLLRALHVTSIGDAIAFGLIVGVGYLAAMTVQIAINPNFPRPFFYAVLNAPFFILTSVITALLLTLIR